MRKLHRRRALSLLGLLALLILGGCPEAGTDTGPAYRSVSIVRSENILTVSWEAAPEAEGYLFYMAENREDTEGVLPLALEMPVYVVNEANSGSVYYFWVKAVMGGGETGDWWALGSAAMPVAAPANIILSRSYTSIYVFWDGVNGASSYEVWYSRMNKSDKAERWTGPMDGTSTEIQNLKSNVSYYIWVRALSPEGPSPFSGVKNDTTGPPKMPAVPSLTWTIRMRNAVGAVWSPAENATSYDFCYGAGTNPSAGTIVNVRDTVCLAEGLTRNINYRIWVRAKNAQYASDWTAMYEVKTGQGFPSHIEGTYFSRWPAATHGGAPYYMDGYQIGRAGDMRRDFPFNKTKFTGPKYSIGLPAHLVDRGISRDLPGGASYDDDDQYVLYHFNGFMGIVRAVLERQPRDSSIALAYVFLELFSVPQTAPPFTVVQFSYYLDSNYYLRGVNQYSVANTELSPAVLKEVSGKRWDAGVAYPGLRLGYAGDTDADFHPQLLRPEPLVRYLQEKLDLSYTDAANIVYNNANRWNEAYFPLADLWNMVNW